MGWPVAIVSASVCLLLACIASGVSDFLSNRRYSDIYAGAVAYIVTNHPEEVIEAIARNVKVTATPIGGIHE